MSEQNKEKVRVHWAVKAAIKAGKIIRMPCEECGDINSHAHHKDYALPFDITWLCCLHHKKSHRTVIV